MAALDDLTVPDAAAWRDWLEAHHDESPGVWLALAKKGTTEPTRLTYAQALDEALCQGWIDGQVRGGGSGGTFSQRFTPRRVRSSWSARNVGLARDLIDAGRMRPAGLEQIRRAQEDGRWDAAYPGSATIEVPDDLTAALADHPRAAAMFEILTAQNRYAVLYRLTTAARAETRARRLERFVEMLDRGETPYPQRRQLTDELG